MTRAAFLDNARLILGGMACGALIAAPLLAYAWGLI